MCPPSPRSPTNCDYGVGWLKSTALQSEVCAGMERPSQAFAISNARATWTAIWSSPSPFSRQSVSAIFQCSCEIYLIGGGGEKTGDGLATRPNKNATRYRMTEQSGQGKPWPVSLFVCVGALRTLSTPFNMRRPFSTSCTIGPMLLLLGASTSMPNELKHRRQWSNFSRPAHS